MGEILGLIDTCKKLELHLPMTSRQIFEEFNLLSGHPWEETAASDLTTYYPCLYGVVQAEKPRGILEIGTAFGLSAATLLKACSEIDLFISADLGIFGDQYGFSHNNIDFARYYIHSWCYQNGIPIDRVRFYCANTQPPGKGDNDNEGADIPRWHQVTELVRLLQLHEFDVIFVDGKHTEDGLFNDLNTFWPFLKPGGLILCDDLHDETTYKDIFPWAGDTLRSFEDFLKTRNTEIDESFIWDFPQVPPEGKHGLRPFGLIRKKPVQHPLSGTPGFEVFDSSDAIEINRARQDHLASLGLDLVNKTVLEVGAGIGWHTAFFEKLGCSVLSTDARHENVEEHRRRYPHRRAEVADLSIPGSHARFGEFDIVYCYGTLYHLRNPALCIKDLSINCRGLFLLETCVSPNDNGSINPVEEGQDNPNQSFEGIGCRPGRDWIMSELKKYFPYVYITTYQPDHSDFPLNWPATLPPAVLNARSVFVASRQSLNLPTLSSDILSVQQPLKPVLTSSARADSPAVPTASNKIEDYIILDPGTGKLSLPPEVTRVWIDVGAHEGETTLPYLRETNNLAVIAFEPLIEKYKKLKKSHPRMIAVPMAVSSLEGLSTFYITENYVSSSLNPFNPDGLASWKDKTGLNIVEQRVVPTIRLERILELLPLDRVELLKIDTQGHDLNVVKSAGSQLHKIDTIKLEVAVTPVQLYEGAETKDEVISYMTEYNFSLVDVESQTNGQEENLTFRKLQNKLEKSKPFDGKIGKKKKDYIEAERDATQFPNNDKYWTDTADFVQTHIKPTESLIAPDEFKGKFLARTYSYPLTFNGKVNSQWAIIHKGMLNKIDFNSLECIVKTMRPVFTNEVFVIFTSHNELPEIKRNVVHYNAFKTKMRILKFKKIIKKFLC